MKRIHFILNIAFFLAMLSSAPVISKAQNINNKPIKPDKLITKSVFDSAIDKLNKHNESQKEANDSINSAIDSAITNLKLSDSLATNKLDKHIESLQGIETIVRFAEKRTTDNQSNLEDWLSRLATSYTFLIVFVTIVGIGVTGFSLFKSKEQQSEFIRQKSDFRKEQQSEFIRQKSDFREIKNEATVLLEQIRDTEYQSREFANKMERTSDEIVTTVPTTEEDQGRGKIEYKILNTLWTKQINKWPTFVVRFAFRTGFAKNEENAEFYYAVSQLIKDKLIGITEDGLFVLTKDGWNYCHTIQDQLMQKEQWWPEETVDIAKLRIAYNRTFLGKQYIGDESTKLVHDFTTEIQFAKCNINDPSTLITFDPDTKEEAMSKGFEICEKCSIT
ncbi:MAG: hypothetical protein P9L92_17585 [Candidatus Electryonea clarkiae]|nr:hypothetical protein [Candidatus Electryonea clarkiae]MDP8287031.1 hypothetical protein [Candidatus Electryonea clarkiae]